MEKKQKHFIHKPEYKGGPKALTAFIYDHLRYPDAALHAQVEGMVLVEYDIDNKGRVVDTRVIQGLGYGCDEEACRVVRLLQFEVNKNRGLRVLFHQKANIQFKRQVVSAPLPTLPQTVTYQYVVTPAVATPMDQEPVAAPETPVYSYSITI
jgi:TonB family protein